MPKLYIRVVVVEQGLPVVLLKRFVPVQPVVVTGSEGEVTTAGFGYVMVGLLGVVGSVILGAVGVTGFGAGRGVTGAGVVCGWVGMEVFGRLLFSIFFELQLETCVLPTAPFPERIFPESTAPSVSPIVIPKFLLPEIVLLEIWIFLL